MLEGYAPELAAQLNACAAFLQDADEQAFERGAHGVTLEFEDVHAVIRLLREARDVLSAPVMQGASRHV